MTPTYKRNKKIIEIAFISDVGYLMPTSVAIASLIENRDKSIRYNINLIVPQGYGADFRDLELEYSKAKNVNVSIKEVSMDGLIGLHTFDDATYLSATETSLLKFKLPEILDEVDKILFLDSDIIVCDNLVDLYDTDLEDYIVAAVRDLPQVLYDEQEIGGEINGRNYFNSGVMLLNLKKMREQNISNELIEAKRKCNDNTLMDQNIFNIVLKNKVLQLDFCYNVCYTNMIYSQERYDMSRINDIYGCCYENIYNIVKDIKIVHFSSKLKPWLFYDVPMSDLWLKYYYCSTFKNKKLVRTWHENRDIDFKAIKEKIGLTEKSLEEIDKIIPVVLAADENYFPFVTTVVCSIAEHSNKNSIYDINVLVDNTVPETMKRKIEVLSKDNIKIKIWDVSCCFEGIDLYSVGHYSKQMYYRWLIPEIFSYYDKVIYLDSDVVVQTDLNELINVDIGDAYIGAVNNFVRSHIADYIEKKLGLDVNNYYNSGVLLIRPEIWIKDDLKNRCLELLKNNEKLVCPDQDVLNMVCNGKVYRLEDRWNYQWHHRFGDIVKGEMLPTFEKRYERLEKKEKSIIHFTSQIKPWNNPEREYAFIFWEYCRKTPFYEEILFSQITKKNECNEKYILKKEHHKIISSYKKRADSLQYQLNETRKSITYKIGRIMTVVPRKMRNLVS